MKKLFQIVPLIASILLLTACTQADKVSYNLSEEADNFNVVRKVTVINAITNDIIFEMSGKMSITADTEDNQLEIVVENGEGEYQKKIIGLSNNVSYVVEDVTSKDVDKYKYTINYNPKMWVPVTFENID